MFSNAGILVESLVDIFRAAEKSNTRLYIHVKKNCVWMTEWSNAHCLKCSVVMVVCGLILSVDD